MVNNESDAFINLARSSKFKFFMLKNLPSAYFSGVRIKEISEEKSVVVVPFKWFSKNPFHSTYFACLAMAAELSTGLLAMANVYKRKPTISMLVVKMEAQYYKKATGMTAFTCNDGLLFTEIITNAIKTGEAQTLSAESKGINSKGELVAEFTITWSFKVK